ncbi:MAG: FAD-dependent thymidylate synthase, partial [Paludibacteraceae bacterium]|nr:FAD-dependent thymidylate synthase [Paludibacteraceae bacterium]
HFVRHHIGVNHYVSTQRDDRVFRNEEITRADLPQGQMVSHIMSVNAQELMFMSRKRLCKQAEKTTRKVMKAIVNEVHTTNHEFKEAGVLVPNCVYRNGKCDEFFPCDKDGEDNE